MEQLGKRIFDVLHPLIEDREVFERRMGRLHTVDTASDADSIIDKYEGNKNKVRFRVTYSGELKASGKKPRVEEKDAIRKYISSQLAELWTIHPVFKGHGLVYNPPRKESPYIGLGGGDFTTIIPRVTFSRPQPVDVASGQSRIAVGLSLPIEVQGRKYVPLVRSSFALTCGLDILFLRKGGEGALVAEGGDLDNRIKTLFDGLRVPKPSEIEVASSLEEAESITFCLLEDDALITDFSVRTDRLLTHPGSKDSEVLLVIDVIVKVSHLTSNNLGFLSE